MSSSAFGDCFSEGRADGGVGAMATDSFLGVIGISEAEMVSTMGSTTSWFCYGLDLLFDLVSMLSKGSEF